MKLSFSVLLFSGFLFAQPTPVVIRNARVIDGTGAPARAATVVIRDGRIAAVSADTATPELASGTVPGPRVTMAARISTPGGHGTEGGWGDFMTITVNTAAQAHARMKTVLAARPGVIKVFTDGWRYGAAPDLSSMNLETLTAIVQDAHAAGIKVVTHTVTLGGAKLAARAGVDVLVHGIGDAGVDPELIEIMKAKGTAYVSTLAVYEFKNGAPESALPLMEPAVRETARPATSQEASGERQRRWRFLTDNVHALF